MQFREYLEMASFILPHKLRIGDSVVSAVDMQFEKHPATINSDGRVMNQGSKFIAKVPQSPDYLSYDGQGSSEFVKKDNLIDYIKKGFHKIPDNWWKKANFITNESVGSFSVVTCKDLNNPNFQIWGALSDLKCKNQKKLKLKNLIDKK